MRIQKSHQVSATRATEKTRSVILARELSIGEVRGVKHPSEPRQAAVPDSATSAHGITQLLLSIQPREGRMIRVNTQRNQVLHGRPEPNRDGWVLQNDVEVRHAGVEEPRATNALGAAATKVDSVLEVREGAKRVGLLELRAKRAEVVQPRQETELLVPRSGHGY